MIKRNSRVSNVTKFMAALQLQIICNSGRSSIWLWKLDLVSSSFPSSLHKPTTQTKTSPYEQNTFHLNASTERNTSYPKLQLFQHTNLEEWTSKTQLTEKQPQILLLVCQQKPGDSMELYFKTKNSLFDNFISFGIATQIFQKE